MVCQRIFISLLLVSSGSVQGDESKTCDNRADDEVSLIQLKSEVNHREHENADSSKPKLTVIINTGSTPPPGYMFPPPAAAAAMFPPAPCDTTTTAQPCGTTAPTTKASAASAASAVAAKSAVSATSETAASASTAKQKATCGDADASGAGGTSVTCPQYYVYNPAAEHSSCSGDKCNTTDVLSPDTTMCCQATCKAISCPAGENLVPYAENLVPSDYNRTSSSSTNATFNQAPVTPINVCCQKVGVAATIAQAKKKVEEAEKAKEAYEIDKKVANVYKAAINATKQACPSGFAKPCPKGYDEGSDGCCTYHEEAPVMQPVYVHVETSMEPVAQSYQTTAAPAVAPAVAPAPAPAPAPPPAPPPAPAPPAVDCVESDWTPWGACDSSTSKMTRTRSIITPPSFGGFACKPELVQEKACSSTASTGSKATASTASASGMTIGQTAGS